MQTLKDRFNAKAKAKGRIDLVTYWTIVLTLLDLCRKLGCRMPDDLPPPPQSG